MFDGETFWKEHLVSKETNLNRFVRAIVSQRCVYLMGNLVMMRMMRFATWRSLELQRTQDIKKMLKNQARNIGNFQGFLIYEARVHFHIRVQVQVRNSAIFEKVR